MMAQFLDKNVVRIPIMRAFTRTGPIVLHDPASRMRDNHSYGYQILTT